MSSSLVNDKILTIQQKLTITGAFGFYAGLNLLAWGMIFCVRPMTHLKLILMLTNSTVRPRDQATDPRGNRP